MCVQVFSCVFLLFSIVHLGNPLECFNCSVSVTAKGGDPCKGIGTVGKCQDPAVCLSATYSYEVPTPLLEQNITQYVTYKTCYPDMGGKECEMFLKNIKNSNPSHVKIEFIDKCFTCQEKGCNEVVPQEPSTSTASDNGLPYIMFTSLLCYFSTFL